MCVNAAVEINVLDYSVNWTLHSFISKSKMSWKLLKLNDDDDDDERRTRRPPSCS